MRRLGCSLDCVYVCVKSGQRWVCVSRRSRLSQLASNPKRNDRSFHAYSPPVVIRTALLVSAIPWASFLISPPDENRSEEVACESDDDEDSDEGAA